MEVYEFKDVKTCPDPVQEYPPTLKDSRLPLIIDNGSYQCRVGWINQQNPCLTFKSVIAKPRKERNKKDGEPSVTPQIQVGNDITNLEAVRFQLKTQFDRNVVTHFEAQEHIFDYLFTHLGINNEGCVPHPIVMTEAFLNPNYSRQLMSELLFECYGVPSIAYGVDSLFSYFYSQPTALEDGLIINIGYHNIHIIPVLNSKVIFKNSRRINIGGQHIIMFLHRLLQLKYPVHTAAITLGRAEELIHEHCYISIDYQEELNKWTSHDYYEDNIMKFQLPFTVAIAGPALTVEQQKERKKELAKRLMDMNARKREERLAEDEEKYNQLQSLIELYDEGEEEEYLQGLAAFELKSFDDLQKNLQILGGRIDRTRQKIAAANNCEEIIVEDKPSKIPKLDPLPMEDMAEWLINVKRKRQEILNKKAARKQRRNDMAKRRTVAAQERMRIITQLAKKEKGNDDFGIRDEDWDVYKAISREGNDSDSELENEKLLELEVILRQHEPNFENSPDKKPGESHQLHIGIERFRVPELIFQPSMIGSIEAGLTETIGYILSLFTPTDQSRLVSNIVLGGGSASFPGLKERLVKELREIRPFQSSYDVNVIKNPMYSGWHGARNWAKSVRLSDYLVTKNDYNEYGGEYFKVHRGSNLYYPTPKSGNIVVDVE